MTSRPTTSRPHDLTTQDTMPSDLQLGPFRLDRPLARGGMARIFRATHIHHDQPVAVKVMTGEQAKKSRFVESFRGEVRAVARMNHPNIIRVFDYGEIPEDLADDSDQGLSGGSPYMVMELAESTLSQLQHSQLHWSQVHTMLVYILDALAHSHARGLIHRDLKPDNILFLSDHRQSRLKLTDFGIAYGMDGDRRLRAEDEVITGTPRYMAPEQIRGRIRDQGPWTDLYALGCLTYWMVTGHPPFSANTVDEVLRAHLTADRPTLTPRINTPDGFEQWTARLVARNPHRRFQRAADAAAALTAIAGEPFHDDITVVTSDSDQESLEMTFVDEPGTTCLIPRLTHDEPSHHSTLPVETVTAEIPHCWRQTLYTDDLPQMMGVGQNLFELREIPLLGRHQLRDALWEHLLDACYARRPHLMGLQGPVGVGKTRLATWLAQHAHEVGAADVLSASHSPVEAPSDGLPRMFADYLRCTGLERGKVLERVRKLYGSQDEFDADDLHQCIAVTDLIMPGANPEFDERQQAIRFTSPEQKWVVYQRLLIRLTRRRPLVLVFDDVHWANETLQFIKFLLQESSSTELPILLVLTVRDDLLDDNPIAAEHIDEILDNPCAVSHPVGPLKEEVHRELVESLLCLAPEVAEQVAARTRGNPLFAVQLVGDWVQRGLLRASDNGFVLAADFTPPLPDGIRELLVRRLENHTGQPLDAPPNDALLSLELAAVLGGDVEHREWRTACAIAGVEPPQPLLETLAAQSLVVQDKHGWSFLHGALREILIDNARDQGRIIDHHRYCADMLQGLYDTSRPAIAPRLADHLLNAQAWQQSLQPLCLAMQHAEQSSDYDTGLEYFQRHENARRHLGLTHDDPRTLRGWLNAAELHLAKGDADDAKRRLDACQSHAEAGGHPEILARVHAMQSRTAFLQGRYDDTITLGENALEIQPPDGDVDTTVRALQGIGWSYVRRSKFAKALRVGKRAEALLDDMENRLNATRVLNLIGACENNLGNPDAAQQYFQRAREQLQEMGHIEGVATLTNNLGDMSKTLGEYEQAAEYYQEASTIFRRVGAHKEFLAESNLGMLRIKQRNFDDATAHFRAGLEALKHTENASFAISSHLGMATCAAYHQDLDAFDHHFERVKSHLEEVTYYNKEIGLAAQTAGELLQNQGEFQRARRMLELARDQWGELENQERTDEVQAMLDALDR